MRSVAGDVSMDDLQAILDILRCPETGAELEFVDEGLLRRLNGSIRDGELADISGEPVRKPLEMALQPTGAHFVYPVRGGIPNFLIHDRILLADLPD